MRRLVALFGTLALAAPAVAQTAVPVSPDFMGIVEVGASVQQYSSGEERGIHEVSSPFGVSVWHRSGVGLRVRGLYASAGGDGLQSLSGLADVQVGARYRRRFGSGAAVEALLDARLPGAKSTLTNSEFATSAAIAFDDYAFDTPTIGQGTTIAPGLTVVVPVGRALAVGVAAAYYARAAYAPFEDDETQYSPADETVLTAGLDAQTGRASTFALDVTFVNYGDDEFDGRTFSPGNRFAGTARWNWGGGRVRGRLLARYRHVFDGVVAEDDDRPVPYQRPSHAVLATGLGFYGNDGSGAMLTAGARYYGVIKTAESTIDILNVLGEQQVLLDFGIEPVVTVMPRVRLRGVFTYTVGVVDLVDIAEVTGASPLSGFRAGGGLSFQF